MNAAVIAFRYADFASKLSRARPGRRHDESVIHLVQTGSGAGAHGSTTSSWRCEQTATASLQPGRLQAAPSTNVIKQHHWPILGCFPYAAHGFQSVFIQLQQQRFAVTAHSTATAIRELPSPTVKRTSIRTHNALPRRHMAPLHRSRHSTQRSALRAITRSGPRQCRLHGV